jgi:hypothetical protein
MDKQAFPGHAVGEGFGFLRALVLRLLGFF